MLRVGNADTRNVLAILAGRHAMQQLGLMQGRQRAD